MELEQKAGKGMAPGRFRQAVGTIGVEPALRLGLAEAACIRVQKFK